MSQVCAIVGQYEYEVELKYLTFAITKNNHRAFGQSKKEIRLGESQKLKALKTMNRD